MDDQMAAYVKLYLRTPVRRYEYFVSGTSQYVPKNYDTTAKKGLSSSMEVERVDSKF